MRQDVVIDHTLKFCICHPESRECGRTIDLVNWDVCGPDQKQYEGFRCEDCEAWCSNECGNRDSLRCNECEAQR